MTLQQKMLAKQSKKGFTLVELVVVIAILAILAAIAIPAVIGIINSASASQTATDAASIDSACKTYHGGIVAGTINNSNKPKALTTYSLPAANATNSTKKTYANSTATVQEACMYDGIWDSLGDKINAGTDFGYKGGSIVAAIDESGAAVSGVTTITGSTTLGTFIQN